MRVLSLNSIFEIYNHCFPPYICSNERGLLVLPLNKKPYVRLFKHMVKIDQMQEMLGIADLITVAVKMYDLAQAFASAIPGTFPLAIIVIGFTKETADCLHNQFSLAVVVNKAFVVCWPAFSDFSATRIMDIHTERQSQTEESCIFQAHSPFQSSGQLFTSLKRSIKPHIIQSIVTAALSIVIFLIDSQRLSTVKTASVAVNMDEIQTQFVHIPFGSIIWQPLPTTSNSAAILSIYRTSFTERESILCPNRQGSPCLLPNRSNLRGFL